MTCRQFGLSAVVAAALMSAAPAALRQPQGGASSSNPGQAPARSIDSVLDALDRVRACHETAISPDGRRVAWVEDVSAYEFWHALKALGVPTELVRRRMVLYGRMGKPGADSALAPSGAF